MINNSMKSSNINKNLNEAVEKFGDRPISLGKRLKTKLKKHTPFAPGKRAEAETKDKIFRQAKKLKLRIRKYAQNLPAGQELSIDDLENFFSDTEYADYFSPVAIKLGMKKAPVKEPEAAADKEIPADKVSNVSAEKLSKEKKAEIEAGYKKRGEEAGRESNKQDIAASKDDDKKPKIDTSASIYEARLYNMLTELKDNEIDTLIVRTIQAKNLAKGGPVEPSKGPEDDTEQPMSRKEKQAKAKAEKKAKEAEKQTALHSQAAVQDDDADDTFKIDNNRRDQLENILRNVSDKKELSDKDRQYAKQILNDIRFINQ